MTKDMIKCEFFPMLNIPLWSVQVSLKCQSAGLSVNPLMSKHAIVIFFFFWLLSASQSHLCLSSPVFLQLRRINTQKVMKNKVSKAWRLKLQPWNYLPLLKGWEQCCNTYWYQPGRKFTLASSLLFLE